MAPTARFYMGMAMGALVLISQAGPAHAQSRCEADQLKTQGKHAYCAAKIMSKAMSRADQGVAGDPNAFYRCDFKAPSGYDRAESRGDCRATPDVAETMAETTSCVSDLMNMLGGVPWPTEDWGRCAGKEAKETGKLYYCIAKERSKAVKRGEPPYYGKCWDKYVKKMLSTRDREVCLEHEFDTDADYIAAIYDETLACVNPLAAKFHGDLKQTSVGTTSCVATWDGAYWKDINNVDVELSVTPLSPIAPNSALAAAVQIESITCPGRDTTMVADRKSRGGAVFLSSGGSGNVSVNHSLFPPGVLITDPWVMGSWGAVQHDDFQVDAGASSITFDVTFFYVEVESQQYGSLIRLDCAQALPGVTFAVN